MFSITFQTSGQSSRSSCYILHYIFLLHICTAFLTIISAFNNTEEIIRLPIHEAEPSNLRIVNLEENDDVEKELLVTLLQSYNDKIRIIEQLDYRRPSIDSSLSIRFDPPDLHFSEQPIAIPRMQTVMIINDDSKPLELYSISGNTTQLFSSFFQKTILQPYGGHTSIDIYYLPRTIGTTQSIFTMKTNRGQVHFNVYGQSKSNPHRLHPLISATIPLNSTFEYTIGFYNPFNSSLDINEIYTSDENLNIELLSKRNIKNKITKNLEFYEQWHLEPFEIKSVIKIKYWASELNRFYGFVFIKTNFTELIILPVKINVSKHHGLYSNVDVLEFTTNSFIHSTMKPITIPIYVFNYGLDPLIISDVHVIEEHKNYFTISYKSLPIPADIDRLNRIAEITIHPTLIPTDIQHLMGFIQIYTLSNSDEPRLQIPYDEIIYHGSLDYEKEHTRFYLPSSNKTECQSIKFINRYNIPLSVYNITVNNSEFLSPYIEIIYFSSIIYLYPDQWIELLRINLRQQPLSSISFDNIQAVMNVHTNLSSFPVDIYLYNGFLTLNIIQDHTNGGIRQDENNPLEFYVVSIPINTTRTVTFVLTNPNPIDINIDKFDSTLPNADIQLNYLESLNDNKLIIKPDNIYINENISQLVIPEQHRAVFLLTINGRNQARTHNESITFQTNYQTVRMDVNYQIVDGSLEFANKTLLHIDASLYRIETIDIFLHNKFSVPVNVLQMDFQTHQSCFAFTWPVAPTTRVRLQPNRTQRLGKLSFDMTALCKNVPSESTVSCGLNHHAAFKQQWDEHVLALNTYELDYTLVTQFRNLWKEWTLLVRKQKIQTNIWIYTDRANISLPISVGFFWPSVLEQMFSSISRAPIILDFQVIFINITKTQNIIITNPSLNPVIYTVELLSNDSVSSKQIIDDQIFTISTTSKRVDLINGLYNFYLQPSEQMIFTVSYRPTQTIKHEMYFIIRNNFTVMESIHLRGEGGIGSLQVGHRQTSSPITPIVIAIDEKQHKLCSNSNRNLLLRKVITLYNTGNMKTIIYDISFDQERCFGHGFTTPICVNIEIESNEKHNLQIIYQPDYTTDEVNRTLTLNTNIGLMTFPIHVRIPQRILSSCYQIVPRPPWELRTYYLCLCSLVIMFILIFFVAGHDARRIFDNYLTRAEWRELMQTTNNKIFDLSDLSLAVQDEEKTRERIESLVINDIKKEKTTESSKNQLKSKRSTTPVNDKKEILGKPRTSTGSTLIEPKPAPEKVRRATTDSGPSKSSKNQHELVSQSEPQQRRKKSDQRKPPAPPKGVSSSTVSDEESEPFVAPRSRRLSSKTKKTSSNVTPTAVVDTNPIQSKHQSSPHYDRINPSEIDNSIEDRQWKTVQTSKGQVKSRTSSRREPTVESQVVKKTTTETSENQTPPSSVSIPPQPTTNTSKPSRRRHRRPPAPKNASPIPTPNLVKRNSLQDSTPLFSTNRELAFRQLTEQLWAAGLPTAATACSMSIRSRCSSAPPSERGGGDGEDERIRSDDDDLEENLDWDEPDIPDDDFGRYALQNELDTNERTQTQQKTTPNNIPPLMSLSVSSPAMTTSAQEKSTTPTSVIKENIEPITFPQHSPGPIQRPNKLAYQPNAQSSAFFSDTVQSPSTPDVLVQINHLLHHQNSITTVPPMPNVSNSTTTTTTITATSTLIQDLPTPNVPWTPFSTNDWSTKYDSTWPMTTMQSSNVPSTTQMQNPFALRQVPKEETTVWPTALGTATPRSTPLTTHTKQRNEWNEIFPSVAASSVDSTKSSDNNWPKFLPVTDSPSVDNVAENKQENEGNNSFWNPMTPSNSTTSWWPKTSTDETNDTKDQSRWDFAR